MSWLFLLLGLVLIVSGATNILQWIWLREAERDARQWKADYNALEKGTDEIQEGYEQEYLTWEETEMGLRNRITELTEERNELKEVVEKHDLNCLLDVEEMRIAALKAASLHE